MLSWQMIDYNISNILQSQILYIYWRKVDILLLTLSVKINLHSWIYVSGLKPSTYEQFIFVQQMLVWVKY